MIARPDRGTRVVQAGHDRLIVTHSEREATVVVLRPAGVTTGAVLQLARLVLPAERYDDLARHLLSDPPDREEPSGDEATRRERPRDAGRQG